MNLYHGTTKEFAKRLLEKGWQPNQVSMGANQGQSKYLYVTNEPENAQWFAEQKGGDVILEIINIPADYLGVDPEDGIGESVNEEIDLSRRTGMPAYLVIKMSLEASNFKILSGSLD